MALTVSSITAEFMKDTKTIGALNGRHPVSWHWRETASAGALTGSHHPSRGNYIGCSTPARASHGRLVELSAEFSLWSFLHVACRILHELVAHGNFLVCHGIYCMTGKQAAYLDFDFGGRIHHTETLKKAGKSATWEHPVQLTGAGVNMKVCLRLWEGFVSLCYDGVTKDVPVEQYGKCCMYSHLTPGQQRTWYTVTRDTTSNR